MKQQEAGGRVDSRSHKAKQTVPKLVRKQMVRVPATQTSLNQLPLNGAPRNGNGTGFRDPAFAENKVLPVHRWVPWIAGFSTKFVEDCLDAYLSHKPSREQPQIVLDPFAGVGTTMLTATLRGYDAVGFDINPWAALACDVKLSATFIKPRELEKYISAYENTPARNGKGSGSLKPAGFKSRIPFFSPTIEIQVLTFLNFVESISSHTIADVFRVAFGSVMVSFSNYTYEPSLGSRPGAGKPLIENADVRAAIVKKLREMLSDIRWLNEQPVPYPRHGVGRIFPMDFMDSADVLEANSVHLMVTSPPYMNNYHYIRNTRPQLYWLACVTSPDELKSLEERNLGKYWQTVRDQEPITLNFHHAPLERTLTVLRNTRQDKGVYGGAGWANYVTTYFNDSLRFLTTLKRVLRRGAVGVIVIGNSIIQGHEIKTERILGDLAEEVGLDVQSIDCVRSKRVGASITQSSVRRGDDNPAVLYESTVTVRKK